MPKTITDIIPPSRRKAMQHERPVDMAPPPPPPAPPILNDSDDEEYEPTPPKYPRPLGSHKKGFPWMYVGAALVAIALSIGTLYAFSGARVEVLPTMSQSAVSGEFAATGSSGDLPYDLITAESIVSESVPAEGTEQANDVAQGSITVYNAQAKPQQLIKNTRFETPAGLIFRIRDSISVPAGSPTAPGELKVTVYADEGGEKYNVGATSFTIPGLKGSETFDMVYARSSEAMTGGFSGVRASVSAKTKEAKYAAMKPTIDAELASALLAEVPEGYALLPGATWTTYEPQPDTPASGTVTLNQKGIATAAIFPKEALAKAIASRTIESYNSEPVTLAEPSMLTLASMTGSAPAAGDASFSFTLSGNTTIKWIVDPAKIAGAVAGKSREAAKTILNGYPEVDTAEMVLRPFWAGKFPTDAEEIKVLVEGESEEKE